jgi:hypothetical protein
VAKRSSASQRAGASLVAYEHSRAAGCPEDECDPMP